MNTTQNDSPCRLVVLAGAGCLSLGRKQRARVAVPRGAYYTPERLQKETPSSTESCLRTNGGSHDPA